MLVDDDDVLFRGVDLGSGLCGWRQILDALTGVIAERQQELLDISGETLAVDGAIEHERRVDTIMPERGQKGERAPMAVRHLVDQRLTTGTPAAQPRHVGLGPGFVDEDEAPRIDPALILAPLRAAPGDRWPILLAGDQRLFLNVIPASRTIRHTDP